MKRLTYTAATFLVLATAGAAFAQSPTRPVDPCAMDYNCNPPPKGKATTNNAIDPDTANAARLRNEAQMPRNSNEPEQPEQPLGHPVEPEAPISGSQH